MAVVRLEKVWKTYPNGHVAARGVDLAIADGEFMVLVGPSGCGKSTALRMIAGLETPSEGKVIIGDRDVTELPPQERDIAMVFQSYALYPHMTVRENLAFGLRMRGVAPAAITERVNGAAEGAGPRQRARPEAGAALGRPAPARRARPRHRAGADGRSSSTSRSPISTPSSGWRPGRSWPGCIAGWPRPWSTSPTIRKRR